MKFFRITNGFDRMSDANLMVKGLFIHQSMAGNASFPTPTPTLDTLDTTLTQFQNALQNAETGNHQDIALRNQLRQTLITQLHLLGNYVLFTAAGNEVVATSSGFSISRPPAPKPPIAVPEGLSLKNGLNKGELELSLKRVAGARSYVYEITASPVTAQSQWESVMSTVSKNLFAGLESGREYACRVAAVGVKKQLVYSDVITRVAL